jgi:hypothetical protein
MQSTHSLRSLKGADDSKRLLWQGPDLRLCASFEVIWETSAGEIRTMSAGDWILQRQEIRRTAEDGAPFTKMVDTFTTDVLELVREVVCDGVSPSSLQVRLIVFNRSQSQVRIHRLTPIVVEGPDGLQLGAPPANVSDWALFRSGRQKNDLPSVCVLGRYDEAYADTLVGLTETGRRDEVGDGNQTEITSDELTVVVGKKADGTDIALLLGITGGTSQLTECRIRTNEAREKLVRLELACLLDGVPLESGQSRAGEWVTLDFGEPFETVERFIRSKQEVTGSMASPNPPSVFCTWYYYGDTVEQDDVYTNLKAMVQREIPIDVIQVDEGWERRFGDWEANHRFPDGMERVARRIREAGYRPGIWTAPFLVEPRCGLRFHREDWLLKNRKGEHILFYMNRTHNYILDVTRPDVQAWIEELYRKLTGWGYSYHKLDFTRAVAIEEDAGYYNPNVTRAEAYRMGIEAVRRGMGPDGYLLICGGLFSAPAGLADAHRTSSDVLSMWSERQGRQGGKVAPFTIKQNVLRYWMSELWHNDPDALMVRRQTHKIRFLDLSLGLLNDNEARVTALNQYWGGGLVCFSEPMEEIDDDRIGLLRHVVPALGKAAVPRDMYSGSRYASVLGTAIDRSEQGLGCWHTVSVVNWNDQPERAVLKLDEALLGSLVEEGKTFAAAEFWSGKLWRGLSRGSEIDLGLLPAHSSAHLKLVQEPDDQPVLLYTNGHFAMGGQDVSSIRRHDDVVHVGIDWHWRYPLDVILLAPSGSHWATEQRSTDSVNVSADGELLTIRIAGKHVGELIVRLGGQVISEQ